MASHGDYFLLLSTDVRQDWIISRQVEHFQARLEHFQATCCRLLDDPQCNISRQGRETFLVNLVEHFQAILEHFQSGGTFLGKIGTFLCRWNISRQLEHFYAVHPQERLWSCTHVRLKNFFSVFELVSHYGPVVTSRPCTNTMVLYAR